MFIENVVSLKIILCSYAYLIYLSLSFKAVLTRPSTTHKPCSNIINSTPFEFDIQAQGLLLTFLQCKDFPQIWEIWLKGESPYLWKMKGILQEVGRGVQFWRANSMTYVLMCHVKSLIVLPTTVWFMKKCQNL